MGFPPAVTAVSSNLSPSGGARISSSSTGFIVTIVVSVASAIALAWALSSACRFLSSNAAFWAKKFNRKS